MIKKLLSVVLSVLAVATVFSGCTKKEKDKEITVGASVAPHAEILKGVVADELKAKGYTLKVVEYNDYVIPNNAVENGENFANYFQHKPYLDDFNNKNKTHLVDIARIHFEPFAIFGGKSKDIKNVPQGAKIAVPNDATNEARALLLLEAQGIIKLKEGVGLEATKLDIVENPNKVEIVEIEAAQLVRSLADVDFACINGNYAISGGLKATDALAYESKESKASELYANVLVVKKGNENSEKAKVLKEALQSDKVRKYIEDKYKGAVVPVF